MTANTEAWFRDQMRATPGDRRLTLLRYRAEVERLRRLELRDRWGHLLEVGKLAALARYVVLNLDHGPDADGQTILYISPAEAIDRLLVAMMTGEAPTVCSEPDTVVEDDDAYLIIEVALNLDPDFYEEM